MASGTAAEARLTGVEIARKYIFVAVAVWAILKDQASEDRAAMTCSFIFGVRKPGAMADESLWEHACQRCSDTER